MKLTRNTLKQIIQEELKGIYEMQYHDPAEESAEQLLRREVGEKVHAAIDAIAVEYDESSEEGDLNSWRELTWSVVLDAADQYKLD